MIRGKTIPFMAISILFMMLALFSGIFRLMGENGVGPALLVPLYGLHPLLMVFGFIAGIIMTERIAGVELLPASRDSRLSVSMIPFVFAGVTIEALGYGIDSASLRYAGALLLVIGSALFLVLIRSFYRKGRENLSVAFMMVSGASLLISSVLSALELPAGNTGFIMLLLLFPITFILGERVELTSLASGRRPERLRPALVVSSVCVLLFGLGSTTYFLSGVQLADLTAFVLLAATFGVFLREELASSRRTPQNVMRLHRYVRLHVGAAYFWGLAGSVFGAVYVISPTFQSYDAFIHSLAIGFIGLMLLAHGPIILPVVIGRSFEQKRLSNVPLVLLTLGLLLRIVGNTSLLVFQSELLRLAVALSGWIILAAVTAFFAEIVRGIRGGEAARSFGDGSGTKVSSMPPISVGPPFQAATCASQCESPPYSPRHRLSLSGASRRLVNESVKSNRIAPLSKGCEGGARLGRFYTGCSSMAVFNSDL